MANFGNTYKEDLENTNDKSMALGSGHFEPMCGSDDPEERVKKEMKELKQQLTEANALIEKLHTALDKHTEWEAEFIGENECWQHLGNPRFNDKVYDGFIAYQGIRNNAIKQYNEYKTKQTTTTQEVK